MTASPQDFRDFTDRKQLEYVPGPPMSDDLVRSFYDTDGDLWVLDSLDSGMTRRRRVALLGVAEHAILTSILSRLTYFMANDTLFICKKDPVTGQLTSVDLTGAPGKVLGFDTSGQLAIVPGAVQQQIRAGKVTSSLLTTLSYVVAFTTSMPDANYELSFNLNGLGLVVTPSAQTKDGFTIGLSAGLPVGKSIGWTAVQDFNS